MFDGNILVFALLAALLALLVVAFVLGRLAGLRSRGAEELSIEALRRQGTEEQTRLDELRKDREGVLKEGLRAQDALDRWETVRHDHENLDAMRQELDAFEREESNRIDELERRRAEAAQRLRDVQEQLGSYPPEITNDADAWNEMLAGRKEEYDELQQAMEDARKEYAEADARRVQAADEAARLESRRERLNGEIETAQEALDRIKQEQVDALKPYNERLFEEAKELQSQVESLNEELDERKESLAATKTELAAAQKAADAVGGATIEFPQDALNVAVKEMPGTAADKSDDGKLGAFSIMPDCLLGYDEESAERDEDDLLREFEEDLKDSGLQYPGEIIRAFHTALKVNDLSPLTVLSGLSGTGKSQLPRAYARFFGIHFLHVPVEPGWDSPQDLLGFYDFVAERYRPTDRARALGYFDSHFAEAIEIEDSQRYRDRMLIILLDEMNLARTEYYFSEFLSRLEMRGPRASGDGDEDSRRDAQIAIDLPYAKGERPRHLYVPHNVLWVGTLNEDETTQALSDKVLDRANSIRFAPPNPDTLREHSTAPERSIRAADGYLPYERWLEWSKRRTTVEGEGQEIDETLQELAKLMQGAGRGFGYRITQSIKAYIERYPGQDWRVPMIDQINMRLLPKLSGVEMNDDCRKTIEGLINTSGERLGRSGSGFAKALRDAKDDSEVSQTFTWSGYTYEETTD